MRLRGLGCLSQDTSDRAGGQTRCFPSSKSVLLLPDLYLPFQTGLTLFRERSGPFCKEGMVVFPGDKLMSYVAAWEVRMKGFDLDHKPW